MDLNATPSSERIHIGIFGKRNAGKSSLINAITGQNLAIVSDTKGTTTDPVYKAMEILPLGPVMIIDTPGIDDEGELGTQRVQKQYRCLTKPILPFSLSTARLGLIRKIRRCLRALQKKAAGYSCFYQSGSRSRPDKLRKILGVKCMAVNSVSGRNIAELRTALAALVPDKKVRSSL